MANIVGTGGNDVLRSTLEDDTIYGKLGNDLIHYGNDSSYLYGNDEIYGGIGVDTLIFYSTIEHYKPVPAISVDLQSGEAELSLYGSSASLALSGIENISFSGDWGFDAWGDYKANHFSAGVGWGNFHGRAGNDLLNGGHGDDALFGDEGNDTLQGAYGNDTLFGGDGDDSVFGEDHDDGISGGDGNDTLDGGDGNDIVLGGRGNDAIVGGAGDDDLVGDAGNDQLDGGDGNDTLSGGDGNDVLNGGADLNILNGDAGNDVLVGGASSDILNGGTNDDLLIGGYGNDTLIGGSGTDTVEYLALFGQDVDVDLAGGNSVGEGFDSLSEVENVATGAGNDTLGGDSVANVLTAGAGNDVVSGLGGNDQIDGGTGDDTLGGDEGNDELIGKSGNDTLSGGGGNDTLNSGSGFDTLEGGAGIDTLTGFHHADDFVFAPGDSSIGAGFRDVITDFSTVQGDDLDLTAFGGLTFIGENVFSAPDQVRSIHSGGNTLVQINTVSNSGMEMEIQLNGIFDLSIGDFIL